MYDVAIMITHTPDKLLGRDFATISFRMSHWNELYMTWFAAVRLFCLFVTSTLMIFYFVSSCKRSSVHPMAWINFNFEQVCICILLFLCAVYDDPLFELRRVAPSAKLAIVCEIPVSLFYTGLLTYWIMGLVYMRKSNKVLSKKREVSLEDITGALSLKRAILLVLFLFSFTIIQTWLHLIYLTTETNRAIFSSFRHFKTSENLRHMPITLILIALNLLFGVIYIIAFIVELTRSCLDFNRLNYS
mmetsp:Transcript_45245/g.60045  ORF Transcript_45245/g.60045 Transcript_45245/m.60045 type:complete len:245 (+) Transcript_45245:834-1568(+)